MVIFDSNLFDYLLLSCLGYSNPAENLYLTAFFASWLQLFLPIKILLLMHLESEILNDSSQGAGAAMTQFGYRIGGIMAGAGALYLREISHWKEIFLGISFLIFLLMVVTIF